MSDELPFRRNIALVEWVELCVGGEHAMAVLLHVYGGVVGLFFMCLVDADRGGLNGSWAQGAVCVGANNNSFSTKVAGRILQALELVRSMLQKT
jgi:hypothetical protein